MRRSTYVSLAFLACCVSRSVHGQERLTLAETLARARLRSPEIMASISRVEEARAGLVAPSSRFRDNPVIEIESGPRHGPESISWDFAAAIGQTFETGGQRGARISRAEADVRRELATGDETLRLVLREVAAAFVSARAAQERVALLGTAETAANDLRDATARRYAVGDVAAIDLNLTRLAAARATGARHLAEADLEETLRPIRLATGIAAATTITLDGPLELVASSVPSPAQVARAAPAVRAIEAEIAGAEAEIRLGRAQGRPDLGLRLEFDREAADRSLLGGVAVTWPLFDRGQGLRAVGQARAQRLALERERARLAVELELQTGVSVYQRRAAAAAVLRDTAIPAIEDNETLAQRSFEAGEMNLLNLLIIRQDGVTARLAYVDAAMEAAVAVVSLESRAGALK